MTIPNLLEQLLLFPSNLTPSRGRFYADPSDERLPPRGGGWISAPSAGRSALILAYSRSYTLTGIGSRPAFVF